MSDTPRTDAVHTRLGETETPPLNAYWAMREHAETAEREFEEVRKKLWAVIRERDYWKACAEMFADASAIARYRELKGATL